MKEGREREASRERLRTSNRAVRRVQCSLPRAGFESTDYASNPTPLFPYFPAPKYPVLIDTLAIRKRRPDQGRRPERAPRVEGSLSHSYSRAPFLIDTPAIRNTPNSLKSKEGDPS